MGNVLSREIMNDWKRLQNQIRENINREEIKQIVRERYNLDVGDDDIEVRQGKSINHQDQQALELDLRVGLSFSVLIDEDGNYTISEKDEQESEMTEEDKTEETGQDELESTPGFER